MDVYKVGVSLLLSSNASQIFGALGHHFLGLEKHLVNFRQSWTKTAALVGTGFGIAGLKGVEKLVDKGNDLVKIQRDMAQAGVSATQVQEAYNKAWEMTAKYQNVSAVEILKMQNDARMTFGDQKDATHHIEDFVAMESFLKAYQGGKHAEKSGHLSSEVNAAMKSGEIAGKIKPEDMAEHVKQLTAMKVAYGEQVKISQYLTAQRHAGVALRNTSDEFRYGMFPALVQENGANAGTMLMTAFNKVVAGTGNRTKSLEQMADIHLLKRDQLDYDKAGRIKGLKDPSAILNNTNAAINFGDWVHKTLLPLLDRQTKNIADPTKRSVRQTQLISSMFPDRNAAKAVNEIVQQYTKLQKDAAMMHQARQSMNGQQYTAGSWDAQKQAFETQFTNFLNASGAPMVAKATEYLGKLNNALSGFSQWASKPENADTLTAIGKGIAILSAAFTGAAIVAMLAAIGPAGWLAGGIIAFAGAVAVLGKVNWSGITSSISSFADTFNKWGTSVVEKARESLGLKKEGYSEDFLKLFGGTNNNVPKPNTEKPGDGKPPGKQSMLFNPATATQKDKPISLALNIDGRTLAQAVSEQIALLSEHNTNAPGFNGAPSYG